MRDLDLLTSGFNPCASSDLLAWLVCAPNNDHCHPVPRVMTWQPVLLMEWHLPRLPAVDILLPAGSEPRVTADGLVSNRIATGTVCEGWLLRKERRLISEFATCSEASGVSLISQVRCGRS